MNTDNKVYVGDVNTKIKCDAGVDISTANVITIKYKKPSGTTGNWTGTVADSNYGQYITQTDDLDEPGDWVIQPYYELSGGWEGHGEVAILRVDRVLL